MAVSKTQNERPAIIALIDLANLLETSVNGHTTQIANLQGALASEINSRVSADTLLGNRILAEETARENAISEEVDARENAIANVMNTIGDNFDELHSVSDFEDTTNADLNLLQNFMLQMQSLIKFGVDEQRTVQGNNYYDGTVTYQSPYPNNFTSFVIPAFISYVDQRDLELAASECTDSGFSYTVVNRGSTSATFTVGYLAIGFSND